MINNKINSPNDVENGQMIIRKLKEKYLQKSPATFLELPSPENRQYGKSGHPENGKRLYELSCKTCHQRGGVTHLILDDATTTFRYLKRRLDKSNHFSVYYMVRKGTYAVPGHRPYMPNFTKERMSEQQLEDLISYIQQAAK